MARLRQTLGTTTPGILPGFGREYLEPVTEKVADGATEVWNVYNLTADTHPIHFHLVNVQVLSRQPFKVVNGVFTRTGVARGPEPNEIGWKETVQMHPGEVTSVIMKFELPPVPFNVPFSTRVQEQVGATLAVIPQANEFVWHCHILEHEEHDMMRPLVVTGLNPKALMAVSPASQSVTLPTSGTVTVSFTVSAGIKPITIAYNNGTFPAIIVTQTTAGFDVDVPAGSATGL